jgi:hypothetical protein
MTFGRILAWVKPLDRAGVMAAFVAEDAPQRIPGAPALRLRKRSRALDRRRVQKFWRVGEVSRAQRP